MRKEKAEIWELLTKGKDVHHLDIAVKCDRFDLSNLYIAEPYAIQTVHTDIADIATLGGITKIQGVHWQSLDFSTSQLAGLRLSGCKLYDCVFDKCKLSDLRVWGTEFSNVSFRPADLRGAMLGGVIGNNRNLFKDVDFTQADMRGTMYKAAEFVRCKFKNTKLDKVDFQSSTFTDCSFEGELREVLFYNRGFRGEMFPENKMERVDFSNAKLRWTEFRRLGLQNVIFPEDNDHIIIENLPLVLTKLLGFYEPLVDPGSRKLKSVLENKKKWLGQSQMRGVFNKKDIIQMAGDEGLKIFMKIVRTALN